MEYILKQKKKICLFYNYYYSLISDLSPLLCNLTHEILLQRAAFFLLCI